MFVEKVLRNQKRIDRTIEMYEENQKKLKEAASNQTFELSEKEAVA